MVDAHPRFGLARRALFAGLTVAVAATAAAFTPAAAYADDQAVIDEWTQLTSQQLNDEDFQAHTSDGLDAPPWQASSPPTRSTCASRAW